MSGCLAKKILTVGLLTAVVAVLVPFSFSCSKPPKPVPDFTFSYVSGELLIQEETYITGTAPLTVRFTDQSAGEITSWRWNFGDGTILPGGEENKVVTHTYESPNSSGYIVSLTVRGPGGEDKEEKAAIVTVISCSEAANSELNMARAAVKSCLTAAGKSQLDQTTSVWDGSRGKVVAGGKDAADYLGVWDEFKATYNVSQDGTINSGADMSWGCIRWDPQGSIGKGGWRDLRSG